MLCTYVYSICQRCPRSALLPSQKNSRLAGLETTSITITFIILLLCFITITSISIIMCITITTIKGFTGRVGDHSPPGRKGSHSSLLLLPLLILRLLLLVTITVTFINTRPAAKGLLLADVVGGHAVQLLLPLLVLLLWLFVMFSCIVLLLLLYKPGRTGSHVAHGVAGPAEHGPAAPGPEPYYYHYY